MELPAYSKKIADKIRHVVQSYLKEENPLSRSKHCCLSFKANEFSIIHLEQLQDMNNILLMKKFQFDDLNGLALILNGIVESNPITDTPISWMLNIDDYQLNLIESMPVPANEMQTALSWRIRSLISYPMEQAALEYFELPAKKGSQNMPIIAAVTAEKSKLQPVIDLLKKCELHLVSINIPELSLLNLVALYETDEKCTAFLYFYKNVVLLNISCQKILYFTRRINILFTAESVMDYEKLSLEILRYFDFFRSQWRLSSPTRIFAASETGNIELITQAMTERLLNKVVPYTLPSTILNDEQKIDIANSYLLDYGCLLSKDGANAKTTS